MTNPVQRAGCSYFGVRIPRHVRRDMADLAARGYTGVLHTFSENDFAYYRDTMAEIVAASHSERLFVQASPWGLGRTFGGEAESRWVAFHPEECQVLDDGRRVAAACLNSSAYRDFCKEWADWALEGGVDSQFWVPSFGLTRDDVPDLEAAIEAAREEGVGDLWTWGYEACGHMTSLATPDAPLVWEAVSAALTGRSGSATTEAARPDLADLDLRSTRDLVRLLNEEDATVPGAVADAGNELAAAVDAIVERLRRGGRLVYVGAGTSGALAALDASELPTTFGSPPGEVVAVAADREGDEDDRAAATNALLELPLR